MFETKIVQKTKKTKHIFYVQERFSENRAFYKVMWNNMVQPVRPQMTIVGLIRLHTHTQNMQYFCFPTEKTVTRMPLNFTL